MGEVEGSHPGYGTTRRKKRGVRGLSINLHVQQTVMEPYSVSGAPPGARDR